MEPLEQKRQKALQGKEAEERVIQQKRKYNSDQQGEDQKPLQFKLAGEEKTNSVKQLVAAPASNQTGIPDELKQRAEQAMGVNMDDVRVHYNSEKPAQLQALAYTQGMDVYMGPGQEKHLTHELGHVVQQKQGRVQPTIEIAGQPVNDAETLEKEADQFGNQIK